MHVSEATHLPAVLQVWTAVPMHYVDSGQSRGLLLVVPSVDEIGHDVG